MSKIAAKVKQLICNHFGKEFLYWNWIYTLTGVKEDRIEIHYKCHDCHKEIIETITGQQAKDYATIMFAFEKK